MSTSVSFLGAKGVTDCKIYSLNLSTSKGEAV